MADEKLKIIIEAQDKASTTLKNVQGSINSFNSVLSNLMALGGVVSTVTLIGTAINKALEFGEAGARLENLSRSFGQFAEQARNSSDKVLLSLQEASRGMMAQSELMEAYNKATLLAGQSMATDLARLMQVAMAASAAGMGDVNYLLNSLVLGVGRLSPMILDNLGLTIQLTAAYDAYAQSVGKTADELSDTERKQAAVNEIMRVAQDRFGDLDKAANNLAGGGIARLKTAWQDLMDQMQREPSGVINQVAGKVADAIQNEAAQATPGTSQYIDAQLKLIEELGKSGSGFGKLLRDIGGWFGIADAARPLNDQLLLLALRMDAGSMSSDQLEEALRRIGAVSPSVAATFGELAAGADNMTKHEKYMIEMTKTATAEFWNLAKVQEYIKGLGGLSVAQSAAWGHYRQNQKASGAAKPAGIDPLTGEPWYYDEQGKARDTIDSLKLVTNAYEGMASGSSAALDTLRQSLEEYSAAYQNMVKTAMQPTQVFSLTNWLDQHGMHQDTWDEPARRVMDIANRGGESPWAEKYGITDKAQAAQWVQNFYNGKLLPEVNWDALAQNVQEHMAFMHGQQMLAAEALTQMQARGLGAEQGDVMQALGFDVTATGVDAAEAFSDTFIGTLANKGGVVKSQGAQLAKTLIAGVVQGAKDSDVDMLKIIAAALWPYVRNYMPPIVPPTTPLGDVS